jgi:RHS repeat-associated protein
MTNMIDASGTNKFTYTATGQLQSETNLWISSTFSDVVSYAYNQGHRTSLSLTQPSGSWSQTYGYDFAWRLTAVTSPAGAFGYQYVSGAQNLVSGISLPNGSVITNNFDANGRLTGTSLMNSLGGTIDDYVYSYNQASQRTSCVRAGGIPNYVNYTYDPIGEVTSDLAHESIGSTLRRNEQLHYLYDAAGNLQYRTNDALIQNFQVNSLNELTAETNGGRLTVMGATTPIATNVTVNGSNAVLYGDYSFVATNMPLTNNYTALALGNGLAATNTVAFNLASNAVFQYDGNGNLTNDGWSNFVYDDENQLIQVSVSNQWMSQFVYDGKMRRRIRSEFAWQGTNWVQTNQVLYVYDGNLVIQERATNNQPLVTYTRGRDLSGSLQGAGGIGGLLARTDTNGSTYYHADGNGNITMLINSSQAIVAKYLYDAFGNVLSASGLLANANVYQFSSKEKHLNSGLVYYLHRYYDPNLQRWPNRDPIGERGGINLYTFEHNNPISQVDPYGLDYWQNPYYSEQHSYDPGPPTAFAVEGTPMSGWYGPIASLLGIQHVDITYKGVVIYVGLNGNNARLGQDYQDTSDKWPLYKRTSGRLIYGANKPCKCATEADILNCIEKAKQTGPNCQGSVANAIHSCCLKGWGTLVSLFSQ